MVKCFMKYFIIIILFCSSCKIDQDKNVDRQKFKFKTGDDTELFFKNVRQSYYEMEENRQAKFNVFRYAERLKVKDGPMVNPAIVHNYIKDEAYLLIEPNDFLQDQDSLKVKWKALTEEGHMVLASFNHEQMLEFASQLYEGIRKNASFEVMKDGQYISVLDTPEERETFRITMSDYYRLTRIY